MNTLRTSFEKQEYCYYGNRIDSIDFNSFTDCECINFIKNYFITGGKERTIEEIVNAFEGCQERASHSVSAYMIGLLAYSTHKQKIDIQFKKMEIREFSYIWFLSCLYHDYGYFMENNNGLNEDYEPKKILADIHKINSKYWGHRYNYKLIKKYFKFREYKDHGIIAGALLRARLYKNLDYALNHGENYAGLCWSKSDKKRYNYAAGLIIKHNIWFANTEVEDSDQSDRCKEENRKALCKYSDSKCLPLKKLIIDNSARMTFDEDPLLFLFFVIDTIEPIKAGRIIPEVTNADILNAVNICFIYNKPVIEIVESGDCFQKLYDCIYEKAKQLETWMKVNVYKDVSKGERKRRAITIQWESAPD